MSKWQYASKYLRACEFPHNTYHSQLWHIRDHMYLPGVTAAWYHNLDNGRLASGTQDCSPHILYVVHYRLHCKKKKTDLPAHCLVSKSSQWRHGRTEIALARSTAVWRQEVYQIDEEMRFVPLPCLLITQIAVKRAVTRELRHAKHCFKTPAAFIIFIDPVS